MFNAAEPHFPRVQFEIHQQFPNAAPSNTASVLDAVSIAGRVCATPTELAKLLGSRIVTQGILVNFIFPQHTISSAADASFLAIHHHETHFVEIAQMAHPTVFHDGEIYLPLDECLRIINESGVASVEQDEAVITVHREESENKQEAQQESSDAPATTSTSTTTFIAPNDDSPSTTTEKSYQNTPSGKFDKPTRNRYILPDDLKRRGVEAPTRSNAKAQTLSAHLLVVKSLIHRIKSSFIEFQGKKSSKEGEKKNPQRNNG